MATKFLFGSVVLALVLGIARAADTYPSSYPFENEYGEGLPDLNYPASTPSYTFDTADNGGYEKLRQACDWGKEMAKDVYSGPDGKIVTNGRSALGLNVTDAKSWSPYFCPGAQYSANMYLADRNKDIAKVKVKCTVPKAMKQQWDTKWATSIAAGTKKSFSGYLGTELLPSGNDGTKKECTDCCQKWNQEAGDQNLKAGIRVWVPPTSVVSQMQTFLRSDVCSISLGEHAKCFAVESLNVQCVQNYISASKRSFLYPCPDLMLRHFYSCKLRMAAARVENAPEPPKYAAKVSAKISTTLFATNKHPDRICQPYSYYYPALKKPSGSSDYYSPGSPLGRNDPSGGSPTGTPGSTPAPSNAQIFKLMPVILGFLMLF